MVHNSLKTYIVIYRDTEYIYLVDLCSGYDVFNVMYLRLDYLSTYPMDGVSPGDTFNIKEVVQPGTMTVSRIDLTDSEKYDIYSNGEIISRLLDCVEKEQNKLLSNVESYITKYLRGYKLNDILDG